MLQALATLGQRVLRPQPEDPSSPTLQPPGTPRLLMLANAPGNSTVALRAPRVVTPDPLLAYAMTAEEAQQIVQLQRLSPRALDPDYALPAVPHEAERDREFQALQTFYARRTQLIKAALSDAGARHLPEFPRIRPDLSRCHEPAQVLERLLKKNPGLVVGHVGKRLLAENMKQLRRLGVDTLYLDDLQADMHQPLLDRLTRTGEMPKELSRLLAERDHHHMHESTSGNTYLALVTAARREGLRLVALDLATSVHLKGAVAPDERPPLPAADLRARVFSHVASARIQHDRQALPPVPEGAGPRRWVALVNNAGAGIFNGNPGLAARLAVPSLRVEESPAGKLRAGYDPGRSLAGLALQENGELQCDHLLKVRQYGHRPVPADTPEPCGVAQAADARELRAAIAGCADDLARVGTYRVVRVAADDPQRSTHALVHRSHTGALVGQRIVPVAGGLRLQLPDAVDADRWGHMARPFSDLSAMRMALSTRLEEVPAPTASHPPA